MIFYAQEGIQPMLLLKNLRCSLTNKHIFAKPFDV